MKATLFLWFVIVVWATAHVPHITASVSDPLPPEVYHHQRTHAVEDGAENAGARINGRAPTDNKTEPRMMHTIEDHDGELSPEELEQELENIEKNIEDDSSEKAEIDEIENDLNHESEAKTEDDFLEESEKEKNELEELDKNIDEKLKEDLAEGDYEGALKDEDVKKELEEVISDIEEEQQHQLERWEHDEEAKGVRLGWDALFVLVLLSLSILVGNFMHLKHVTWLPESGSIILFGGALGLLLSYQLPQFEDYLVFNPHFFSFFLLPPIIFESGYFLRKMLFFRNFGTICTFAVFGTIISTLVFGFGIYYLGVLGWVQSLSVVEAFSFAALISAVDPVATLATFGSLGVDPHLNILVYGESVLNDAVSIVLYRTIIHFLDTPFEDDAIGVAFGKFFMISFGSIGMGLLVAALSSLTFKHLFIPSPDEGDTVIVETILFWLFSYISFILTENMGLSGIVASLFCGIGMSHYTRHNLTESGQIFTGKVLKTLSMFADLLVFLLIGIQFFTYHVQQTYQYAFVGSSMALCVIGRAANIFPLTWIVNKTRMYKIPWNHQVMMWFAGLRGAIAVSLAIDMPTENRDLIVSTTIWIVLITVFVMGGFTTKMLHFLDIGFESTGAGSVARPLSPRAMTFRNWWLDLDEGYLRPFLRSKPPKYTMRKTSGALLMASKIRGKMLEKAKRAKKAEPARSSPRPAYLNREKRSLSISHIDRDKIAGSPLNLSAPLNLSDLSTTPTKGSETSATPTPNRLRRSFSDFDRASTPSWGILGYWTPKLEMEERKEEDMAEQQMYAERRESGSRSQMGSLLTSPVNDHTGRSGEEMEMVQIKTPFRAISPKFSPKHSPNHSPKQSPKPSPIPDLDEGVGDDPSTPENLSDTEVDYGAQRSGPVVESPPIEKVVYRPRNLFTMCLEGVEDPLALSAELLTHVLALASKRPIAVIAESLSNWETDNDPIEGAIHDQWREYENLAARLQNVKIGQLGEDEKRAFFLNVYNALILHSLCRQGIPKTSMDRAHFFESNFYRIANIDLSLNDIEHGVLRGNEKRPLSTRRQWPKPSAEVSDFIVPLDPRVHFAMSWQTHSCPPVHVFTNAETVDSELDMLTTDFLADHLLVFAKKREVWLPRKMKWYRHDFGNNQRRVILWCRPFLTNTTARNFDILFRESGGVHVQYHSADWDTAETVVMTDAGKKAVESVLDQILIVPMPH